MPYFTISIIVFVKNIKKAPTSTEYKSQKLFLAIKEKRKYKFWNFQDNAIGARFERDKLDRKFKEEFSLDLELDSVQIFNRSSYRGKNKPAATTLIIEVDENFYNLINERKNDSFIWLSSAELKKMGKSSWIENQDWIHELKPTNYDDLKEFDLTLISRVRQLQTANSRGNLVIFVGAGISKASNIPLWGELTKELKKELGDITNDNELIPQFYFQIHKNVNYYEKIERILDIDNVERNPIHNEIFLLNPNHVVTTNYDRLLEDEANEQGKNYYLIKKDEDLPYSNSSRLIIKMHGDLKEKNIVLKEDDYLRYSQDFPLIENYVKGIFSSKQILFIGFSFDDRNLKKIIESVRGILKEDYRPAILFRTNEKETLDSEWVEYFKSRGVNVIGYEPKIKKYLQDIGKYKKIYPSKFDTEDSFEKKTRTFNFLRFIRFYSDEDSMFFENNPDIVDQMYRALYVYSDLPAIPYKYLERIKPFANINGEYAKYDHIGYHLKVHSPEILKFLHSVKGITDNKIQYKSKHIKEDAILNEKLYFVYTKLRQSAVYCVQRIHDFREEIHNKLKISNSNKQEDCKCLTCLLKDLKLDKAYLDSDRPNLFEESKFKLIKLAKVDFFFANYESSYQNLKKCASLCQRQQDYHLYFLCLYNIKLLKYRIKHLFVPHKIDEETKKDILEEIDNISLTKTIEELNLSKLSKEILHSINNKEASLNARRDLEAVLINIKKYYQSHQNGTSYFSGPNYITKAIYLYRVYTNFISKNFIFDIFYLDHQEITELFAECLFYSLATNSSLKQRLTEIQVFDMMCLIKYCNSSSLNSTIENTLGVKDLQIKLYKPEIDIYLKLLHNYLDSHLRTTKVFKTETRIKNCIQFIKREDMMVAQRINIMFDNILLSISILYKQLSRYKLFKELIAKVIQYISTTHDNPFQNQKPFKKFISSYIKYDTSKNYNEMMRAILNEKIWSGEYLDQFLISLKKDKRKFRVHYSSWNMLKKRFQTDSYRLSVFESVAIFEFLNEESQSEMTELLESLTLSSSKLPKLLQNGISRINDDSKLYDNFIKICQGKGEIENIGNIKVLKNRAFWNYYVLYLKKQINLIEKDRKQILKKESIFSFLIDPLNFNYKSFKTDWLHVIRGHSIWKYLSKSNEKLEDIIGEFLKNKFDFELSEIYWKYFYKKK